MEKSEGCKTNEVAQEDLQSPEELEDRKVDSDDLYPNRQLQKNTEPTQNVVENYFKTPTESGVTDCGSQDQHLIELKRKLRKIIGDYYNKQTQAIVQQTTENPEEILILQVEDSIPTAEHVSNIGSEELWDGIATNKHLETNSAIQEKSDLQRQSSILSSTKGLQQPCEVSEENVRVREQGIITQQETATQDRVWEISTKSGAAEYDSQEQELIEREQTTSKILADYFNKQNQVTVPQRTDSLEEMLFVPVQDSIPTAEHDSIDAAHQEWDRIDQKVILEENTTAQQRSDLPEKISILSSEKESVQQLCEVPEETVKVKEQDMVMQQKSETLDNDTKTLAETDTQNQELMQRENVLLIIIREYFEVRSMLADYFNKKNKVAISQRAKTPKEILIAPTEDSIPAVERDLDDVAQQEGDKIAKKELEANASLQQRSSLNASLPEPRKLSKLSSKEGLHHPCKISNQTVKVGEKQDEVLQQKSATPDNDTKTLSETDTQRQQLMRWDQEMRNMIADYFSKENPMNPLKAEIFRQKNSQRIHNSEDIESQKQRQTLIYGELEELWRKWRRGRRYNVTRIKDDEYKRSHEQTEDATMCHPETEEDKNLEICPENNDHSFDHSEDTEPQKPKQTITYRELQEIRDGWRRLHGDASFEDVFSRPRELQQVEGGQRASSSVPRRPCRRHARILQTPRLSTVPEENIPLVPFEDECPEVAVEISESEAQRFRRNVETRTATYSSGINGFMERFMDRYIPIERRARFSNLIIGCVLCCLFFVVSILIAVLIGISIYFYNK